MSILSKPITEKRYLTFNEVRALYGIGRELVTRLVRERQLHRRMVGKAWRYPVSELEAIFTGETRIAARYKMQRTSETAAR